MANESSTGQTAQARQMEAGRTIWKGRRLNNLTRVELLEAVAESQRILSESVLASAAKDEEIARLKDIERKYRVSLWLGHGCTHALYGDDGELQCNDAALHGILDFKRDPLEKLEQALFDLTAKRLSEGTR